MEHTLIKLTVRDLSDFGTIRAEVVCDQKNRDKAEAEVMRLAEQRTKRHYTIQGWEVAYNGLDLETCEVLTFIG